MTILDLKDMIEDFDDHAQVVLECGNMGGYYHIDEDIFVKNGRVVLVEGEEE